MPEGNARSARPDVAVIAAIALLCGFLLGGLTSASMVAALGIAGIVVILSAAITSLTRLALAVLVFAVGVPATTGLLNIPLIVARPTLQLVLPLVIVAMAVWAASPDAVDRLLHCLLHGASGMLFLWMAAAFVFFLYGVRAHGVGPAGSDLLAFALYAWVIVPILLFSKEGGSALLLRGIVLAMGVSAAIALVVFAVPGLRPLFFTTPAAGAMDRVGFGAGSLYIVGLPICLLLLSKDGIGRRERLALLLCSVLMVASIAVGQSRVEMVATGLNVVLVFLAPTLWKGGLRRGRLVEQIAVAVVVLAALFGLVAWLGPESTRSLPRTLAERLSEVMSFQEVDTFHTREYTNAAASRRWHASTKTFLLGEGLGARLVYYSPTTGRPATKPGPFIDNVWLSIAVKGGLVWLVVWTLTLLACFGSVVRAARRSTDALERSAWSALALCLPVFVWATTAMTHHLISKEAVVVAFATMVGAADLASLKRPARRAGPPAD